jgi:hypothetical protein
MDEDLELTFGWPVPTPGLWEADADEEIGLVLNVEFAPGSEAATVTFGKPDPAPGAPDRFHVWKRELTAATEYVVDDGVFGPGVLKLHDLLQWLAGLSLGQDAWALLREGGVRFHCRMNFEAAFAPTAA